MDQDTVLYNSTLMNSQSPFTCMPLNRGQYASNEELFGSIRETIERSTLYIDEPIDRNFQS